MEAGAKGIYYWPQNAMREQISFRGAADAGLNGRTVRWKFPGHPELNGMNKVPNYRSTGEQLKEYVPYVEFVRSGSKVTGLKWRFVNPEDTSRALPLDVPSSVRVRVWDHRDNLLYSGKWKRSQRGAIPHGSETFKKAVAEKDICFVQVRFSLDKIYQAPCSWNFSTRPVNDDGVADWGRLAQPLTLKTNANEGVTLRLLDDYKLVSGRKEILVSDGSILSAEAKQTDNTVTLSLKALKPGRTTVSIIYYDDGEGKNSHQRTTTPREVIVTD